MSRPYINAELRRLVSDRAAHLCEYCLYPEADGLGFQVNHIIDIKHGGATTADNLCYNSVRGFQEINYPNKLTTETQRTQREEK